MLMLSTYFEILRFHDDLFLQCADVHMVSDSEGDDFEDAPEFGVDDSEMFGLGSSTCRKSPMSMYMFDLGTQLFLQLYF